ncbi:hypothetical protein M3612_20215 [Niallia taxi]|uniref:hypothetical protein n=1 Tax=Niallia taxi TaxID=2499688 RepID=UPI00203EDD3F|nr:hypothetical protein [Niallia taxi]MCM3216815.1 hypothetical protein [Niallia taxi]
MRLRDVLTNEEKEKVDELKLLLMDAFGEKQRAIIVSDINEILDSAKARYYEMLKASEEQSAAIASKSRENESLAKKISNLRKHSRRLHK